MLRRHLRRARRAAGSLSSARASSRPSCATSFGLTGLAGARERPACRPARRSCPARRITIQRRTCVMATHRDGDVAARVDRALRRDRRVAAPDPASFLRDLPGGDIAAPAGCTRGRRPAASAGSKAGAAKCSSRSKPGADGTHPPLPSATIRRGRTGRCGARGDRQHRSGLPADQQIVQPELLGTRPVDRGQICSSRSSRTGIARLEPAPPMRDDAARTRASASQQDILDDPRPRARDPPCRCRLVQRLRARDPCAQQPVLQPRGPGHPLRREPAPCRHAAGHRPVSRNMEDALRRTYDATPDPKLVVAVGDCGCTGGIFGDSYAVCGPLSNLIPVDVAVPGCPPPPIDILRGILAALRVKHKTLPR